MRLDHLLSREKWQLNKKPYPRSNTDQETEDRAGEVSGIPSVAVKCVDIRRNTSGEGDFLDCN